LGRGGHLRSGERDLGEQRPQLVEGADREGQQPGDDAVEQPVDHPQAAGAVLRLGARPRGVGC
jgi:hypothetical protein